MPTNSPTSTEPTDSGRDPAFAASPSSPDGSRPSGLQSGVKASTKLRDILEEDEGCDYISNATAFTMQQSADLIDDLCEALVEAADRLQLLALGNPPNSLMWRVNMRIVDHAADLLAKARGEA